jgi:RNA polymerase sigma factor (sigma-70 family)
MQKEEKLPEKELVEGCARNERVYQEALYRRFFPEMYRYCLRYAKVEDKALEILNQGFLRVFQKIHTFAFKGSLEGWIRRLIFHAISDYFQKENRRPLIVSIADQPLKERPKQSEALENLYLEDLLGLIDDQLPPVTHEVFRLYAIEGFTHKEIAETMGMSIGTSKWHLAHARKRLKSFFEKDSELGYYAG